MIDLALLAVLAAVTWCVSGEGAWGAGLMLLTVLFSGLLAMNFFEPLAGFLENNIARSWSSRWDVIALVGLFAVLVTIFRVACDQLMPTYVYVHAWVHQVGSWGCGLLTGYVTMAFLLTALHTAPLPRDFLGFAPERRMLLGLAAPDRQWLGFTQHVTEHAFGRMRLLGGEPVARMFDGRTGREWDIAGQEYQNKPMPSFILRYATRRERLVASGDGEEPKEPTVQKKPSSGNARPDF